MRGNSDDFRKETGRKEKNSKSINQSIDRSICRTLNHKVFDNPMEFAAFIAH